MADTTRAPITYRRIRAPQEDGETLQLPPLAEIDAHWSANLKVQADQGGRTVRLGDQSQTLEQWRQQARRELLEAAAGWTGSYLEGPGPADGAAEIVMTGHQPGLVHPGVWYKNFVLSSLGQHLPAVPIHVVIDSDLSGDNSLRLPQSIDGQWQWKSLDIDEAGPAVPFECRQVESLALLESLPQRLHDTWDEIPAPLVDGWWPEVLAAREHLGPQAPLGHLLAAGRHRLERQLGLRTWEVPISRLSATPTFAHFSWHLLSNLERFGAIWNQRLSDYRRVHRIRSTSHPVPSLASESNWREAPFWIWTSQQQRRRRLWVRQESDSLLLSDRQGWQAEWTGPDPERGWQALAESEVAIRPRALITTLYCRWLLSDLFLHGIGGAKYDQLTDAMAQQWLGFELPSFATLTATMRLPLAGNWVTDRDLIELEVRRREMRFHPERFFQQPDEETVAWMAAKA